ncbi:DUF421 domain-containing protein [Glutamicibacter arilaitensis]|uniref:DUF421 domain-containing protein n=1 Tax=Glutamicibacter arilaitensis TaxID=256701 RepID=UPI003F8F40AF
MDIVIRAAIAFIVLWLVTRAAGRSTLGELAAFTMVLLAAILAYANMRWPKIGKLTQGRPIVLIRDGSIDRKALHAERIGLDELSMLARLAGIEDYNSIRLAILEANGKVSFFTHEAQSQQ